MAVTDHDHDRDHDQDNFSSVSWTEHADDPAAAAVEAAQTLASAEERSHEHAGAAGAGKSGGRDHDPAGLGSEKLECTVGGALKENDGSKDAFISYLITTHVRVTKLHVHAQAAIWATRDEEAHPEPNMSKFSPPFNLSRKKQPLSADASPTSSSSTSNSRETSPPPQFLPYPTSSAWSTSAATASAKTSPRDERTPCSAS